MRNTLLMITAVFLAYKLGEKQAQIGAEDYYITRQLSPSTGVTLTEYIKISPNEIVFTSDENQATPLFFWDAFKLKSLMKQFNPGSILKLETANQLITA